MPKVNGQEPAHIVGVEIYRNDVRVVRERKNGRRTQSKQAWYLTPEDEIFTTESLRQPITKFTKKSQKALAFIASNTSVEFTYMVTLTYPEEYPVDGTICKKHIHSFLAWLRRRKVVTYLWFLEFQKRGAPHFHILITDGKRVNKSELSEYWYQCVGSEDERHLGAGTRIERGRSKGGLHNYCVKYAYKAHQKNIPPDFVNVGRLWSCSRDVYPVKAAAYKVDSEDTLSGILRGWRYEGEEKKGYNLLFGAAEIAQENIEEIFNEQGNEIEL